MLNIFSGAIFKDIRAQTGDVLLFKMPNKPTAQN
jgi:hypothetical protein